MPATSTFAEPVSMSRPNSAATPTILANAENRYQVTSADLPLCCPMPAMSLWNSHPRVYLAIEAAKDGCVQCPYCGAHYTLVA